MGSQDAALLPSSQARFYTTLPKHCGRGENLGTAICLKSAVGISQGML